MSVFPKWASGTIFSCPERLNFIYGSVQKKTFVAAQKFAMQINFAMVYKISLDHCIILFMKSKTFFHIYYSSRDDIYLTQCVYDRVTRMQQHVLKLRKTTSDSDLFLLYSDVNIKITFFEILNYLNFYFTL